MPEGIPQWYPWVWPNGPIGVSIMFCDSLLHFFFFLPPGLSGAGQRREFAALLYRQAVRDRLRLGGTSGKGGRGKGKATTTGLTIFLSFAWVSPKRTPCRWTESKVQPSRYLEFILLFGSVSDLVLQKLDLVANLGFSCQVRSWVFEFWVSCWHGFLAYLVPITWFSIFLDFM